jgi:transposase
MEDQHEPAGETFFDLPVEPSSGALSEAPKARPRMQRADRQQVRLRPSDLDTLLPPEHPARMVWGWVQAQDLSGFEAGIRAVEGHPGRPPIDPAILFALWLYATVEGIGSARALERLCDEHDAYRWICGGVGVNHHTLADFRVQHGELLDGLLSDSIAAWLTEGLVSLDRTAQDGMRVRASAGASSYRRRDGLERALDAARQRVLSLRAELDADPAVASRRMAARRERAARERAEALERALARLPQIEERKRRPSYRGRRDAPARVSTTDTEVDFMGFADGGRRPAWNVQLATDTGSGIIVGADVTSGSDVQQLRPMVEQLVGRYGRAPAEHLVDAGYRDRAQLEHLATSCGTTLYMPVGRPRGGYDRDPHLPRRRDTPAVAGWRVRMGTPGAQAIYRLRAQTAECSNADLRNHGLRAFNVRGRPRAIAVLLWHVLAHNLLRAVSLRAAAAAAATG